MAVDKILIDTNAYASFKLGDMKAVEIIRYSHFIGINTIVLGELLSGKKEGLSQPMIYGLLQQLFNTIWLFLHMMNTSKPLTESEPANV